MLKVAQWLEWRLMAWDKEQARLSMVEEIKREIWKRARQLEVAIARTSCEQPHLDHRGTPEISKAGHRGTPEISKAGR